MKLILEKLSKSFDDMVVLKDFSLEVASDEILGLVGTNGSGKTTVLFVTVGVCNQEFGRIILDGNSIDRLSVYERVSLGLLLVPQSLHQFWVVMHPRFYGFIAGITVFENVYDVFKSTNQTMEWLKTFGLETVRDIQPCHLSWGQQQRLALIRMCALKPNVLLLDESFSSVDWQTKRKLMTYVRQHIKLNHIATIYATSDISEAKEFGDRIAIIEDGKIKMWGCQNGY